MPVQTLASKVFLPALPTFEAVKRLENVINSFPKEMLVVPHEPVHYFAEGMYARTLEIEKGQIIVGKQHRHEHLVMLVKGKVTINTDKGMETITGPKIWVSKAGDKRALLTVTKCTFFTCHLNPNDLRDIGELEAEILTGE